MKVNLCKESSVKIAILNTTSLDPTNIEDTYNITSSEVTIDEFYKNIYNNWGSIKGYEEVYAQGYDTGGNYHWHGVYSGHHIIKKQLGVESE